MDNKEAIRKARLTYNFGCWLCDYNAYHKVALRPMNAPDEVVIIHLESSDKLFYPPRPMRFDPDIVKEFFS